MGNIVTRCGVFSSAHPTTLEEATKFFLNRLRKKGYSLEATPFLEDLNQDLINRYSKSEIYFQAISYYIRLAENKEQDTLFDYALSLYHQTGQIWLVNDDTLSFLALLNHEENEAYHQFVAYLKDSFQNNAPFYFNASHLESLVTSLKIQISLPGYIEIILSEYLQQLPFNYSLSLKQLRDNYEPELDELALKNQKLHHAKAHALEVKTRMKLLFPHLKKAFDLPFVENFIIELINIMVEFHDYEQIDRGTFSSVEQATADRVLGWLNDALHLEESPPVRLFCQYLVDQIINLASTMIRGEKYTVDLAQLYLMLEDAAIEGGLATRHPSNWKLHRFMICTMLLFGVCDKNPAALISIVENQVKNRKINTHVLLNQQLSSPLIINRFFESKLFQSYFNSSSPSSIDHSSFDSQSSSREREIRLPTPLFGPETDENESCKQIAGSPDSDSNSQQILESSRDYQAFFIAIAPHIGMRVELSATIRPDLVRSLIHFVAQARVQFETSENFIGWFHEAFHQENVFNAVNELFFNPVEKSNNKEESSIDKEVSFVKSQTIGLIWVVNRLQPLVDPNCTLINSSVPEQDAANLLGLELFYKELDREQQEQLVKELILAVVLQAGYLYSQQKKVLMVSFREPEIQSPSNSFGFFTNRKQAAAEETNECQSPLVHF